MSGDSTERYYAEMESARNTAVIAYFAARPHLARTIQHEALFKVGFERGFQAMWEQVQRG